MSCENQYLEESVMQSHQVSVGPRVSLLDEVGENLWFDRAARFYYSHLAAVYSGALSYFSITACVPLNLRLFLAS